MSKISFFCPLFLFRLKHRLSIFKDFGEKPLAKQIVEKLQPIMHKANRHVKIFRNHLKRIQDQKSDDEQRILVLKSNVRSSTWDNRTYEVPARAPLAGLIEHHVNFIFCATFFSDTVQSECAHRDIAVETTAGKLQRINEFNANYDALGYAVVKVSSDATFSVF